MIALGSRDVIVRRLNLDSVEPTTWATIRGFAVGAGVAVVVIGGVLNIAPWLRNDPAVLIAADGAGVPVAEPTIGVATSPQAAPGSPSPDQSEPGGVGIAPSLATHVVQLGETLASIAALYGTTISVITARNDIDDPNRIRVGQELKVPAPR